MSPDWRAALARFLEIRISLNFACDDTHRPCRLQTLGLSARDAVADVITSWAPDGESSICDIRQDGSKQLPEVIVLSVDTASIGEDVFEKKTIAVLEARLAILGTAPATLAVFRRATDAN